MCNGYLGLATCRGCGGHAWGCVEIVEAGWGFGGVRGVGGVRGSRFF
jgi:hypothetical protein